MSDLHPRVLDLFDQHQETMLATRESLPATIVQAAERLAQSLEQNRRILVCGNGGSASDAQHFAAELVGRFERERRALPAIALNTDTSALTAIGNDYGFDKVFRRQVEALGQPGDWLLAISTSGNSPNVLEALNAAQEKDMNVLALTGRDGGAMAHLIREQDLELRVPSTSTARIQEMHILILHCLCDLIDQHPHG